MQRKHAKCCMGRSPTGRMRSILADQQRNQEVHGGSSQGHNPGDAAFRDNRRSYNIPSVVPWRKLCIAYLVLWANSVCVCWQNPRLKDSKSCLVWGCYCWHASQLGVIRFLVFTLTMDSLIVCHLEIVKQNELRITDKCKLNYISFSPNFSIMLFVLSAFSVCWYQCRMYTTWGIHKHHIQPLLPGFCDGSARQSDNGSSNWILSEVWCLFRKR